MNKLVPWFLLAWTMADTVLLAAIVLALV